MSDEYQDPQTTLRIHSLHVYPVKSCAGLSLTDALVIETGLEFDRTWMVVDAQGSFVTQRQLPRMALVQVELNTFEMVLRAPGMPALHVALDTVEKPTRVHIWKDTVPAYDLGELCAQWFSDFLGQPLRLVRHNAAHKRLSDPAWTGPLPAENAFSDGFPLLVTSVAALDDLNELLEAAGQAPVTMERFRPNIVLDDLEAHGEDFLDEIHFDTPVGPVRLKLVKPCPRCTIPDVDPATGETSPAVGDALRSYRADERLAGKITFGMNAIILDGADRPLQVGMEGRATYAFDDIAGLDAGEP